MRSPSLKKRWLFAAVLVLGPYLLVEGVVSTYAWFSWYDSSLNVLEDAGDAITFDAARGYRLGPALARQARFVDGRLEHVSLFRGNAEGFPARQDFGRRRPAPGAVRVAVLGDSFSHAPFLGRNWPDRAEDLTREAGTPVRVLNCSLCAIGLANWWSILTKVIDREDYELDGVVFAVYEGDLVRRFFVQAMPEAHVPGRTPLYGRCPSWDPRDFPATVEDARPYLVDYPEQYLVSREEYEGVLQGVWPPGVPRRFRPVVLRRVVQLARALAAEPPACPETPGDFDPARRRLVDDMRRVLESRRLPALVVHLPSRDTLLRPGPTSALYRAKCEAFAAALGATFVDGGQAFARMKAQEVRAHFYPHDGHWNQKGSDRFAAFMVPRLEVFRPATRRPAPPTPAGQPRGSAERTTWKR